jgi:MarR family transcriptional regulator, organic hydroperoxide resistance regulator
MEEATLIRLLAASFKLSRARLQDELEPHGVHAGQDYLVQVLADEDGLSIGEMASRLAVEVPTVVKTVQRMEAAGIVRREPDPADRRLRRIVLTERGRAVEPLVRAALVDVTSTATTGLSDAERAQLVALLERVRRNLLAD